MKLFFWAAARMFEEDLLIDIDMYIINAMNVSNLIVGGIGGVVREEINPPAIKNI